MDNGQTRRGAQTMRSNDDTDYVGYVIQEQDEEVGYLV